ncbi:MAG: HD domain-containing protein [Paludibacter sp.]|nr:HD domain-containing protein [Paludibacter sp.]
MEIQDIYQIAIRYAAEKHAVLNQTLPDSIIPYAVHLSNVAMEILVAASHTKNFNTEFAIQVALLHDVLEDTTVTAEELSTEFGIEVTAGVEALTKNTSLPKDEQIIDSLQRLKTSVSEVRAVKLADRITNLQKPPLSWTNEKKLNYLDEAELILKELRGTNEYLEKRLELKIEEYSRYVTDSKY